MFLFFIIFVAQCQLVCNSSVASVWCMVFLRTSTECAGIIVGTIVNSSFLYTRWIPVSSTQWCKVPMIMWYKLLKIKCLKLYFLNHSSLCCDLPSVLWRCWLGGRKGIRPGGGVLVWLSVWSEVQTCICPSWCHCHSLSLASVKSRLILPSWYQLNPGSPGQRAVKRMCVCVVIIKRTCVLTVCLCINYGATVAWEWEVVGLTSQLVKVKLWTMQHMNTLPLTISCSSKIQIGFTFLVPAHPGSPGQRAVKRACVCVCAAHEYMYTYWPKESDSTWLRRSIGLADSISSGLHSVLWLALALETQWSTC